MKLTGQLSNGANISKENQLLLEMKFWMVAICQFGRPDVFGKVACLVPFLVSLSFIIATTMQ
jgi:hypothetical protein